MMLQDVKLGFSRTERILPQYDRIRGRALTVEVPETLHPVHIKCHVGPKFPDGLIFYTPANYDEMYAKHLLEYRVWVVARFTGSTEDNQPCPAFGGFISQTGSAPTTK